MFEPGFDSGLKLFCIFFVGTYFILSVFEMALTDYENNIFVVTAQVLNSIFQIIRYNPLVRDTDFRKDSSKDAGGEPQNFQILHCIK